MTLTAAKLLLAYADTEGISIQLTTGTRSDDITIDCRSPEGRSKLLNYAHRTNAARNVSMAERSLTDERYFGPSTRLV